MTNLTISLDEAIVRSARIRALQEGTSLSAKVREFLQQYVEGTSMGEAQLRRSATARLMASFTQADAVRRQKTPAKAKGVTLREALYDDNFRSQARKT